MADKTVVSSLDEWLNLPEPVLPVLKSEREKGTIYTVHKVGFFAVSRDECRKRNVQAVSAPDGKCILPTALLEFAGEKTLCRLPIDLAPWGEHSVAMAHSGMNPFPCGVEFGRLQGRAYAEIL